MATINFMLNSRPNKDSTYTVYLRVTHKGKRKYIATPVSVKKEHFNKNADYQKWIIKHPLKAQLNDTLAKELEVARKASQELKEDGIITPENIVHAISEGERSSSFLEYAKQRTQEIYKLGSFNNFKKYNGFCNKLEHFLTNSRGYTKDLAFNEITPSMLAKFQTYLSELPNERDPKKRLHPNTIEVNLNIFKTLVNRAINIDALMKQDKNPFLSFKYKGVKTSRKKLNRDEIRALEELSLTEGTRLWDSRNCFLFSFYCAGIRAGDLLQLRWMNITSDGRLQYEMDKNRKGRDIKLIEKAKNILLLYKKEDSKPTDYIFPYLESDAEYAKAITQEEKDTVSAELVKVRLNNVSAKNALLNKYLKKVAEKAGIQKNVSMHVARHSFARFAKDRNIDNGLIQGILAHENSKTTDVYMGSFDTSAYDSAMDTIFEEKKSEKLSQIDISCMSSEEKQQLLRQLQEELKQAEL